MAIGITMGDACGIGPELVLMAWNKRMIGDEEIIIGDLSILKYCNDTIGLKIPLWYVDNSLKTTPGKLNVYDCELLTPKDVTIGKISKKCGKASLKYVKTATELCLSGKLDAMVTLPVNKEAVAFTIPGFSGHTSYIAELCSVKDYTMMLVSKKLIVTHVSTHLSLREAIKYLSKKRIRTVIQLTHETLKKLRKNSRIAVAGLNPHAGENGQFGKEEINIIRPAVEEAIIRGFEVSGPIPPDTVFYETVHKKRFDSVVCMYHDQGHIPMKLLDFEGAVNVTLGLSIVRTSVDHGTAFDIAWQGKASTRSLQNALKMARKLIK